MERGVVVVWQDRRRKCLLSFLPGCARTRGGEHPVRSLRGACEV